MKKLEREYLAAIRRYDGLLDMESQGHRVRRVILMLDRKLARYERKFGRPKVIRLLRRYGFHSKDIQRVVRNMDNIGVWSRKAEQ